MAKTIFEKAGGTYTQVGDYMLPDLLPAEEEKEANIGVWAMRHKRYLKQNHKVFYYNLLTSGKLNSYLADIEQHQAVRQAYRGSSEGYRRSGYSRT